MHRACNVYLQEALMEGFQESRHDHGAADGWYISSYTIRADGSICREEVFKYLCIVELSMPQNSLDLQLLKSVINLTCGSNVDCLSTNDVYLTILEKKVFRNLFQRSAKRKAMHSEGTTSTSTALSEASLSSEASLFIICCKKRREVAGRACTIVKKMLCIYLLDDMFLVFSNEISN